MPRRKRLLVENAITNAAAGRRTPTPNASEMLQDSNRASRALSKTRISREPGAGATGRQGQNKMRQSDREERRNEC